MRRTTLALLAFGVLLPNFGRAKNPELLTFEKRDPTGILLKRSTYYLKDGARVDHGSFESYYPDGKIFQRGQNEHGELHGIYTVFYQCDGTKNEELAYRNGKRHGPSRWWSPKGELLTECEYRDGEPWAGRTSTESSTSYGSIEATETQDTFLYQDGKRVAGSKKTVSVTFPLQRPDDLPDMGSFLRWHYYSYEIDSSYPFLNQLPPYNKVPFLIDWCANQKDQSDVAHSQLVALTRVDFGHMRSVDLDERKAVVDAWKAWWEATGKDREAYVQKHGIRDEAAWKLVARGRDLPMPKTSIAIPATYVMTFTFRSGDYGGRIQESITITRNKAKASLVRVYSTKTAGKKTTQHWKPFATADADRIARAVGYLIDHPWLMNDEQEINRRFWKEQIENGGTSVYMMPFANDRMKGRESFRLYYPGVAFSMKTSDERVWWNDDPSHWRGPSEMRFLFAAQPVRSTVYPFIASQFSESKQATDKDPTGWKTMSE